ncbi:hypothetical protein Angca_009208 [Angiostrongylus cantonensis]|nr:hypothetical protein Angca_009208 [Angiostrongylus cantonensis]
MEDIDLGDRRDLIDLVYGQQKVDTSTTQSSSGQTFTPVTENLQSAKKETSSYVVYSLLIGTIFFVLALATILLSAFASQWFSGEENEIKMVADQSFTQQPRRNVSYLTKEEELYEKEEKAVDVPTIEQLRLPRNLEPIWYSVSLKVYMPGFVTIPNEKSLTTDGDIMIKMIIKVTTNEISLNAKKLTFPSDVSQVRLLVANENESQQRRNAESVRMHLSGGSEQLDAPRVQKILYNATLEKVTFFLDKALDAPQQVVLQFPFHGRIEDSLHGLHTSSYMRRDGRVITLAVTDLQPLSARGFYPCFDDPQFKCPLSLKVVHPLGTIVRSNAMEVADSQPTSDPSWIKTTFDVTPPLATHLTGFAVTDFEQREAITKSAIKVRIFSRPEAINSTQFALETAVKVYDLLTEYLGTPLVSSKQDLFAFPELGDRSVSGEGILIFREDSLLFDPSTDSVEEKVKIVTALCYEITHQMSYQLVESVETALLDDDRSLSHPLTFKTEFPTDVYEFNEQTTHDKGASLLRMISAIVGRDVFQKGTQHYVKSHASREANYTDFWESLNSVLPKRLKSWNGENFNVADFANKWVVQMGYPVVDVYRLNSHTIELTQRRFKLNNVIPEKEKFRNAVYWYKWEVPIFYEINGTKQEMIWLHEATHLPASFSDSILINSESFGFYRVNYDQQEWIAIADQLTNNHTRYSATARVRLLSDAFILAEAGELPYEIVFKLISYLPKETDSLPWLCALNGLKRICELVLRTGLEENMKSFILEKVKPLFNAVDVDSLNSMDERHFIESRTKKEIVKTYCQLSPQSCTKTLVTQFKTNLMASCERSEIASECSKVPLSIRSLVYCTGVAEIEPEGLEQIREFYVREVNEAERRRLVAALSCSKDPGQLRKLLHGSIHSGKSLIRKSDVAHLMENMNSHSIGSEIVSNFVLDNWKHLVQRFSGDFVTFSNMLKNAIHLGNEREIKQFERFLEDHEASTHGLEVLKHHLESAMSRLHWLKTNMDTVKKLLNSSLSDENTLGLSSHA